MADAAQQTFRPGDWAAPNRFIDPHPMLHALRKSAPVHFDPTLQAWVLTSHQHALTALKDPAMGQVEQVKRIDALSPADQEALLPLRKIFSGWAGQNTEQEHGKFVKVARPAMSGQRIGAMRQRIQGIMDELLANATKNGTKNASFDIANDVARPLAMRAMADLLGVPSTDLRMLLKCANEIPALFEIGTREQLFECQKRMLELRDFVAPHVAEHREHPGGDLLSAFTSREGEPLDDDFVIAQCTMFLVVGYYPTANLLSNGLQTLFDHPAELSRLRADRDLMTNAIEEMVRFAGPPHSIRKVAKADLSFGEQLVKRGESVVVALGAANRDPAVFDDPDRFDIARANLFQTSLGFGRATYHCTGQALVHMEGEVFFGTLLDKLPNLKPVNANADWIAFPPFGRVLRSLPVSHSST
jgi:cytochrome P450